jgi:hypothetical protein
VGLLEEEPPLLGSAPPLAALSPVPPLEPELAASVEAVPPAVLVGEVWLSLLPPAACSLGLVLASPELADGLEPVVEVAVVAVVVVEVVCVASLSACVLAGGVISGVLRGDTSAVLPLPPQAPSVSPASSTAALARARTRTRAAAPLGLLES